METSTKIIKDEYIGGKDAIVRNISLNSFMASIQLQPSIVLEEFVLMAKIQVINI